MDAAELVVFASFGLVANAVSMAILHRSDTGSLNLRGAANEVFADLLGSVLAVAAGVVIWVWDWHRADPVASLVIAVMILPRAVLLMQDAAVVLLEIAPAGLDLDDVQRHLCGVPGVVDVHDLHAWTITVRDPQPLGARDRHRRGAGRARRGRRSSTTWASACPSTSRCGTRRSRSSRCRTRPTRTSARCTDSRLSDVLADWHPSPRPGYGVRRYDCGPAHTADPRGPWSGTGHLGGGDPVARRYEGVLVPTRLWLRARLAEVFGQAGRWPPELIQS